MEAKKTTKKTAPKKRVPLKKKVKMVPITVPSEMMQDETPQEEEVVVAETPKPKKKTVSKPWNPTKRLDTFGKDPNFHYRWVNHTNTGRVQRLLSGGEWEVVKGESIENPVTLDDGSRLDSTITRGSGLVLMRIPMDRWNARIEYQNSLPNDLTKRVRGEYARNAQAGGKALGYEQNYDEEQREGSIVGED